MTQRFKQRKTILSLIHCQKRHLSAGTKQKKEGRNWFLRPVLSIPHVGRRNIELKPIKADACQGSPASSTAACTHWRPKTLFSLIRTRSIHQFEPSSNGAESGIFPPPPQKKMRKNRRLRTRGKDNLCSLTLNALTTKKCAIFSRTQLRRKVNYGPGCQKSLSAARAENTTCANLHIQNAQEQPKRQNAAEQSSLIGRDVSSRGRVGRCLPPLV